MKGCRPLTIDEVLAVSRAFRGTYAERDKAWFLLGCLTGRRVTQLLSLRVGDVLTSHGRVVDRVWFQRRWVKQKKGGQAVGLSRQARSVLKRWVRIYRNKANLEPDEFRKLPLFPSRKDGPTDFSRLTGCQLARLYGLTCKAMGLWRKAGCPRRADGRYDMAAVKIWQEQWRGDGSKDDPRANEAVPTISLLQGSQPLTAGSANKIILGAAHRARLSGKIGTHSMRKTFAQRLYKRFKGDILSVQIALDHSDIRDTRRYLSADEQEVDAAIRELEF